MIYTFYCDIYREAIMFYAHEVNEWEWPRVHVNVTTFTQFAQTASLLALKLSTVIG